MASMAITTLAKTKQFRVATFSRPKPAIPTSFLELFWHAHTSSLLSSLLLRRVLYSPLHSVESVLNVLDSGFLPWGIQVPDVDEHTARVTKLAHDHGHTTGLGYDVQA